MRLKKQPQSSTGNFGDTDHYHKDTFQSPIRVITTEKLA